MNRASYEAQREAAPSERPFLISRSGPLGLQRYVQTWSGDNSTSWRTLRYNTRMGVGMSMSGLVNFGHDVGGFAGTARPSPELFARWVANGVMHPRFTIHSWHDDGSVNEPWMYPGITDIVRSMIRLRYRLIPFLYTLSYLAAERREPIVNPVFSLDDSLLEESDDFLLGRDLLVASVVEEGQATRTVTLPDVPGGWFEFDTGIHHDPGTVTLDAPTVFPYSFALERGSHSAPFPSPPTRSSRRRLSKTPRTGSFSTFLMARAIRRGFSSTTTATPMVTAMGTDTG